MVAEVGNVTAAVTKRGAHVITETVIGTRFAVAFARAFAHATVTVDSGASSINGIIIVAAVRLGSADAKGITVVTFATVAMCRARFGVFAKIIVVAAAVAERRTGGVTEAVISLTIAVTVAAARTNAVFDVAVAKVITDVTDLIADVRIIAAAITILFALVIAVTVIDLKSTMTDAACRSSALGAAGGAFTIDGIAVVAAVVLRPAISLTVAVVTVSAVTMGGASRSNGVTTSSFVVAAAVTVRHARTITVAVTSSFTANAVTRVATNARGLAGFGAGTIDGILVVAAIIDGLALLVRVAVLLAGAITMSSAAVVRVGFAH